MERLRWGCPLAEEKVTSLASVVAEFGLYVAETLAFIALALIVFAALATENDLVTLPMYSVSM